MAPHKGVLESFSDHSSNLGPKCPDHEPMMHITACEDMMLALVPDDCLPLLPQDPPSVCAVHLVEEPCSHGQIPHALWLCHRPAGGNLTVSDTLPLAAALHVSDCFQVQLNARISRMHVQNSSLPDCWLAVLQWPSMAASW